MDTRLLECFVVAARTLSFTRAAEQLGTTQPLLSRTIKRLEDVVGEPLFDRSRRRIALTAAGAALLDEAPGLIDHASLALRRAQIAGSGAPRTLRVAYSNSMWSHMAYRGIRAFRMAHPELQLDLRLMSANEQADALRCGEIDVGLAGATVFETRGLHWRTIGREPYILALPSDWDVPRGVPIDLTLLRNRPFLIPDPVVGTEAHNALMACCMAAGFRPLLAKHARDASEMRFLVAAGLGAGFAFASGLQNQFDGVYFAPIADQPAESIVEIRVSWAEQRLPEAIQSFIRHMMAHAYSTEIVTDGDGFRLKWLNPTSAQPARA
ncbi:LysR family transcriptional regulator [Novosphingobium bradum]|uniref:LysR family transcriptional regulator n=1 Tax=Novosphingobium bradum TaxID=1737444 RepID=A0ABV7IU49_9SPHN